MEEVFVTMIGSGATTPSPQRGLNSQLVQIGGKRILIDCGEGTQISLVRHASSGPALIDALVLTHFHADHHLGIPGLIKTRSSSVELDPIVIYCPQGKPARDLRGLLRASYTSGYELREIAEGESVRVAPGWRLEAVAVRHTVPAFGYVLREDTLPGHFDATRARADGCPDGPVMGRLARGESVTLDDGRTLHAGDYRGSDRPGRSIAFSGDTAPCEKFIELAAGCELMIHEATFAHAHVAKARAKGHSTARQAGEVAARAKARCLWLAHLSARYADPQSDIHYDDLLAEARQAAEGCEVSLTRDGMHARVVSGEVQIIPRSRGRRPERR
jgi:ribonuclease Z